MRMMNLTKAQALDLTIVLRASIKDYESDDEMFAVRNFRNMLKAELGDYYKTLSRIDEAALEARQSTQGKSPKEDKDEFTRVQMLLNGLQLERNGVIARGKDDEVMVVFEGDENEEAFNLSHKFFQRVGKTRYNDFKFDVDTYLDMVIVWRDAKADKHIKPSKDATKKEEEKD